MSRLLHAYGSVVCCLALLLVVATPARAVSLAWTGRIVVNLSIPLEAVSCPSSTQCTAIAGAGSILTFNPTAPGHPTPVLVDTATTENEGLSAISCPTTSQCTAINVFGGEVTFNPTAPTATAPATIDGAIESLMAGIACPSPTQCTAIDSGGAEATFNPAAPAAVAPVGLGDGNGPGRIVCPSASQCTTVDENGGEVTFNPQAPGHPKPVKIDGANRLAGLACPAITQCTAADFEGNEVTFNPQAPGAAKVVDIDGTDGLGNVACPTISECTIDASYFGSAITFDPKAPGKITPVQVGPTAAADLGFIDCPSASTCVIFSGGYEYIGRRGGAPKLTVTHVRGSGRLVDLSLACTGDFGTVCDVTLDLVRTGGLAGSFAYVGVTLGAGRSRTVKLRLNGTGRSLLAHSHRLKVTLVVDLDSKSVFAKTLTLR